MAHVVCEPCIGVKDHACVGVCPVESFYEGGEMLYINPDECIDCGACVDVCPVSAIFAMDEVPAKWQAFIARAADAFKAATPPEKAAPKAE